MVAVDMVGKMCDDRGMINDTMATRSERANNRKAQTAWDHGFADAVQRSNEYPPRTYRHQYNIGHAAGVASIRFEE